MKSKVLPGDYSHVGSVMCVVAGLRVRELSGIVPIFT
jgi:hypothetical protein